MNEKPYSTKLDTKLLVAYECVSGGNLKSPDTGLKAFGTTQGKCILGLEKLEGNKNVCFRSRIQFSSALENETK
jgi:hypothetical protein